VGLTAARGSVHDHAMASMGVAVGALWCRRWIRGDPGAGEGVVSTRRSSPRQLPVTVVAPVLSGRGVVIVASSRVARRGALRCPHRR